MKKLLLMISLLFSWSLVFAADDGTQQAKGLVNKAIAMLKDKGKDAVIAEINNKQGFKEGEVYVTIYDTKGKCLAHPTKPDRVGMDLANDKDADGKLFVQERIKLVDEKGEGIQEYKFQNPKTKKIEMKSTYNKKEGDLIFSAGIYKK